MWRWRLVVRRASERIKGASYMGDWDQKELCYYCIAEAFDGEGISCHLSFLLGAYQDTLK